MVGFVGEAIGFVWPCSYAIIAIDPRCEYPFNIPLQGFGSLKALRVLQIVEPYRQAEGRAVAWLRRLQSYQLVHDQRDLVK